MTRKSSDEVREALEEKDVEELQEIIDDLEEKIPDERRPGKISSTMLLRCRKKAIASSILEDRGEVASGPERASGSKPKGQQGLGAFS